MNTPTKVKVHRNLTSKAGKWSIQCALSGLVLGHAEKVVLRDVIPVVRSSGRNAVLTTGHKNVHAYLVGHLECTKGFTPFKERWATTADRDFSGYTGEAITYDPYKGDHFVYGLNSGKYTGSEGVFLDSYGVIAITNLTTHPRRGYAMGEWD